MKVLEVHKRTGRGVTPSIEYKREADFTTIVAAKRMLLDDLVGFENDLLTITDEEKEDGFKYVFMTRVDANTLNEKMRSALGIWSRKEKYINNDLSLVFNRLHEYYT